VFGTESFSGPKCEVQFRDLLGHSGKSKPLCNEVESRILSEQFRVFETQMGLSMLCKAVCQEIERIA
jgi:hypothetical protein